MPSKVSEEQLSTWFVNFLEMLGSETLKQNWFQILKRKTTFLVGGRLYKTLPMFPPVPVEEKASTSCSNLHSRLVPPSTGKKKKDILTFYNKQAFWCRLLHLFCFQIKQNLSPFSRPCSKDNWSTLLVMVCDKLHRSLPELTHCRPRVLPLSLWIPMLVPVPTPRSQCRGRPLPLDIHSKQRSLTWTPGLHMWSFWALAKTSVKWIFFFLTHGFTM
jgi:hypothetical protein